MSIDVTIMVFGRYGPKILDVLKEHNLGHVADGKFVCAGFWFDLRRGPGWAAEEIEEAKKDGWFRPGMDAEMDRLYCCTNMGWSYYGDSRCLQFPIAHMMAQLLAIYLTAITAVDDPQSGKTVYYRRTDHPEVKAVIDDGAEGFRSRGYENFCEIKEGADGLWEQCGYKRAALRGLPWEGKR